MISFRVVPRDGTAPPAGVGFSSPFVGTRPQFEQWARLMVYLVVFQNGFFWKHFFDQRRVATAAVAVE